MRRFFAILLSALMLLSMIPMSVSAVEVVYYLDETGTRKPCEEEYTILDATSAETLLADNILEGGWYLVRGEVTVSTRFDIGNKRAKEEIDGVAVHLILEDNSHLKAEAGIGVNGSNNLTIYAQSTGASMGELTAANAESANVPAAIGTTCYTSYNCICGDIVINGGKINATSVHGAAIGGGGYGKGGTLTINGGTITAYSKYGAAIGGARNGRGEHEITINGGIINASSNSGSGIGSANGGSGASSTVTINGGTIIAESVTGAAIGSGYNGSSYTVIIAGGHVTAESEEAAGIGAAGWRNTTTSFSTGENGNATIITNSITDRSRIEEWGGLIMIDGELVGNPQINENMTIATGETMTIPTGTTMTIAEGKKLIVNGTLVINGELVIDGDWDYSNAESISGTGSISPTSKRIPATISTNVEPIVKDADGAAPEISVDQFAIDADFPLTGKWYTDNNGVPGAELDAAPTDAGSYWYVVTAECNGLYRSEAIAIPCVINEVKKNDRFPMLLSAVTQVKVIDAEDETAIAGATFELFRYTASGKRVSVGTFTSNANGKFTVRSLSPRFDYELVQLTAAEGYDVLETPITFRVRYNSPLYQTVVQGKTPVVEETPIEEVETPAEVEADPVA